MTYARIISMCAALGLTAGTFALVALPAFAKGAPVVVIASARPDLVRRHISYGDLNLASLAGERTLNRRVGGAVNGLCLEATGDADGSFATRTELRKCTHSAWEQAHPQISQAVQRAHEIASTGTSTLPVMAITIAIPE
jgi:UrcA family protein